MGIARCLVWIPSTFIICTYFEDKKLPIALAIIHAGSAVGSLIFPTILEYAQKQMGFQNALRIMGSLSFGLLMVSFCLFRPKARLESPIKTNLLHGGAFKKIPYCIIVVASLVMSAASAAGGTFANSFASESFHTQVIILSSESSFQKGPFANNLHRAEIPPHRRTNSPHQPHPSSSLYPFSRACRMDSLQIQQLSHNHHRPRIRFSSLLLLLAESLHHINNVYLAPIQRSPPRWPRLHDHSSHHSRRTKRQIVRRLSTSMGCSSRSDCFF